MSENSTEEITKKGAKKMRKGGRTFPTPASPLPSVDPNEGQGGTHALSYPPYATSSRVRVKKLMGAGVGMTAKGQGKALRGKR